MKAEELMIGDWVETNPNCGKLACGIESSIARVSEIGFSNSDGMYVSFDGIKGRYYDVEIEPIPITDEILEKNGYSYNETRDVWELIPNDGFGICRDEDDNCFYFCLGIFDAFNSYSDITYHYITKVEYVHELQHALKLCKIEKDIVL